jgi:hypothetical protein
VLLLYELGDHKGYGTRAHMAAITKGGPVKGCYCMTFAPLKTMYARACVRMCMCMHVCVSLGRCLKRLRNAGRRAQCNYCTWQGL